MQTIPILATSSDEVLDIRCPYCTTSGEFRSMITYKGGQFVCLECAHQQRPFDLSFYCSCPHCIRMLMRLGSIGCQIPPVLPAGKS